MSYGVVVEPQESTGITKTIDNIFNELTAEGLPEVGMSPNWIPAEGACGYCDEERQVSVRECTNGEAVTICEDCSQQYFGYGFEGLWIANIKLLMSGILEVRAWQKYKTTGSIEEYDEFIKAWRKKIYKD